ncbi:hypothetical protein [Paenisporosarcina sp. NPDC076898]|uniref:hypothetical protein n=1 Tax=unclassified Paenisporosarcina TaxID=2642018 RepID=UPI003D0370FE
MIVIDSIFLFLLWGIPLFLLRKEYRKLTQEEKIEIKQELKRPSVLLSHAGSTVWMALYVTGIITSTVMFQHIAVFLFIVSSISSGFVMWSISIKRSLTLFAIALIVFLAYGYGFFW